MVKEADPQTGEVRMVERSSPTGMSRSNINKLMGRIKSIWKFGVANELVPPTTFQALASVAGLRKGEARETEPVRPVSSAVIDATLPHLPPMVRDMVKLQLLTGARPGEVVQLRAVDIDRSGAVWEFRPGSHKTEHHEESGSFSLARRPQQIVKN